MVTTLAGSGPIGSTNSALLDATFNFPEDAAVDASGAIFVADANNHQIRELAGGQVTAFAGSGVPGVRNDLASLSSFYLPQGVAVDAAGAVLVADRLNNRIRRIAGGQVSTLAGIGAGYLDGPDFAARFSEPTRVITDGTGAVYVADTGNHCIRLVR